MKLEHLEALLSPSGPLARHQERYEDRPQQRAMARAVAEALQDGTHLVVEAGTGTGKTLAYLLPVLSSGAQVVISTATKALQDQIFEKDIPLAEAVHGRPVFAARLKGRGNYVCLTRKALFDRQPTFDHRDARSAYARIDAWVKTTETGDRAELSEVPESHPVWKEITSTSETCTGQACELYDHCFVMRERARAAEAQVVVVNHHLFFADLALKAGGAHPAAGAAILPRYDAVVFDEAHALEDVATTFFGHRFSSGQVLELARDVKVEAQRHPDLTGPLLHAAERIERRLRPFFDPIQAHVGRRALDPKLMERLEAPREHLAEALRHLAAVASEARNDDALTALSRRAQDLRATLILTTALDDSGTVYWVDRGRRTTALVASPIDVAPLLQELLLDAPEPCIFTSATLAVGGNLTFFLDRIGLCEAGTPRYPHTGLVLDSPFDFERQAALYVPADLPEPNEAGFAEAVAEEALALCELTGGRAFVLCTSWRNLEAIHATLEPRVELPLLSQGQAPKRALLERFRSEPSILVATQSFWEGVDVPGEALSLVIIDKLPFASPADPVVEARMRALEERGQSPFSAYQLPQAALALKQGFGRLIRSRHDRGIVAICDTRLLTRRYSSRFLRTLPRTPRFRDIESLASWWRRTLGGTL